MTGGPIQHLRELMAKATPGPWFCATAIPFRVGSETTGALVADEVKRADSALIVALVNAAPALLAVAEAARAFHACTGTAQSDDLQWCVQDAARKYDALTDALAKLDEVKPNHQDQRADAQGETK